jgi:hypothetical protein
MTPPSSSASSSVSRASPLPSESSPKIEQSAIGVWTVIVVPAVTQARLSPVGAVGSIRGAGDATGPLADVSATRTVPDAPAASAPLRLGAAHPGTLAVATPGRQPVLNGIADTRAPPMTLPRTLVRHLVAPSRNRRGKRGR